MNLEIIFTSLSLGLLSTTSPCVLPLYPGFLAYLSGGQDVIKGNAGRYFLGFFVLLGVLVMMLVLGLIISVLSVSVGKALSVAIPFADLVIIGLGIVLIFNINPFKGLPQIQVPVLNNPFVNAFIYGLLYGPIALPCSGPFLVGIFTFSFTAAELFSKLNIFLWFGLGFGLPLLLLSLLSGASQKWVVGFFTRRSRLINRVGGILLVGIGIFDLVNNWDLIQTYIHL